MVAIARLPLGAIAWQGRLWRAARRRRPGRWVLVVAGLGWVVLVGHAVFDGWLHAHGSSAPPDRGGYPVGGVTATTDVRTWVADIGMWVAMVVATMLPLIAANVRFVGLRSPRHSRTAATMDVVTGWAAVWLAALVLVWVGTTVLQQTVGRTGTVALAFGAAAAWQNGRRKRLSVARCHRTFAPPLAVVAARRACRRFGVRLGADCVASCWALMAAMAACGHSLGVIAALGWVSWYERRRPHHDPPIASTVTVIAVTGILAVSGGLLGS